MNNDTNNRRTPIPEQVQLKTSHSTLGVVVGVLIVLLVLILGGLYLWGSMLTNDDLMREERERAARINREPETPRTNADIQALETVSSSDELYAIEADLESTNLDTLETELETIDHEIEP